MTHPAVALTLPLYTGHIFPRKTPPLGADHHREDAYVKQLSWCW